MSGDNELTVRRIVLSPDVDAMTCHCTFAIFTGEWTETERGDHGSLGQDLSCRSSNAVGMQLDGARSGCPRAVDSHE